MGKQAVAAFNDKYHDGEFADPANTDPREEAAKAAAKKKWVMKVWWPLLIASLIALWVIVPWPTLNSGLITKSHSKYKYFKKSPRTLPVPEFFELSAKSFKNMHNLTTEKFAWTESHRLWTPSDALWTYKWHIKNK